MASLIHVAVHASQFPEAVLADLRDSLRARQFNHKFLYDSYRQTQKWLAVHQTCAPSRTEASCAAMYESAFESLSRRSEGDPIHLLGLGCGDGQKDARLIDHLQSQGKRVHYTAVDVSTPMVLAASQTAARTLLADSKLTASASGHPTPPMTGLVCDLLQADDLPDTLPRLGAPDAVRLIGFFGTIHNFEPPVILPKLAALVRCGDGLVFSANLAPGADYAAGVRQIQPQYNNPLTNDWLQSALLDLGLERSDGTVVWRVEPCPAGHDLLRLAAYFRFYRPRILTVAGEKFDFRSGDTLRLFFSYRYTTERLGNLLKSHGLLLKEQWLMDSGEEGVFFCVRE